MGARQSTPVVILGSDHSLTNEGPAAPSSSVATATAGGKCPFDHTKHPQPSNPQTESTQPSKCPIDHSNYQSSPEIQPNHSAAPPTTSNPGQSETQSKCPFNHTGASPLIPKPAESLKQQPQSQSKCPISHDGQKGFINVVKSNGGDTTNSENLTSDSKTYKHADVYNVYGEKINPDNQIELNANQLPVPGQPRKLSTERVKSTIPKGGTEDTWTYPSAQMFYNSLVRKEKDDGIELSDLDLIVSIHNNMNEHTWQEVLRWENMRQREDCPVSLLKFRGRPNDLSPSARFWSLFGSVPFDRHDWIVDRCGKEVRYVIDYYYSEGNKNSSRSSNIMVHVRPAVDSSAVLWDRIKAKLGRTFGIGARPGGYTSPPPLSYDESASTISHASSSSFSSSTSPSPPASPSLSPSPSPSENISDAEFKFLSQLTPETVSSLNNQIHVKCSRFMKEDPENDQNRHIALTYCMGLIICPIITQSWVTAMEDPNTLPHQAEASYFDIERALQRYSAQAQKLTSNKPFEKLRDVGGLNE